MNVLKLLYCPCSLETKCIALAWIGIVMYVIHIAICSVHMRNIDFKSGTNPDEKDSFLLIMTIGIIGLLEYVLLLIGSYNKNRFILLPFLVVQMISIACISLTVLIAVPVLISFNKNYLKEGIIAIFVILPIIGFMLYCCLCAFSLFQELRRTRKSDYATHSLPIASNSFTVSTVYGPPTYAKLVEEE